MNPFDDFVSAETTPLFKDATGVATVCHLLWGDGVRVAERKGDRTKVKARGGRAGWVKTSALGGQSLLELYFIDVGQGDGILIKTPDFRHVMIDGGLPRSRTDTGKNAADFVDWKFAKDYGAKSIALDAMIASHCDEDHYGGLADLLDVTQSDELDAASITVEAFHHAGLSWWRSGSKRTLGDSKKTADGTFWTRLVDDNASVAAALGDGAGPKLHGNWRTLFENVSKARARSGDPTRIARLSHADDFLPGFERGTPGGASIKVLGPVEFTVGGKPALRKFPKGDSQNTNGVSLLLRVDYGSSRILLTGDLNATSQLALMQDYAGEMMEFQCDVAKACHHGSEDVSYAFLQAMRPGVTVISSGDNEGYDHPRPSIIAASALAGHVEVRDDRVVTPLVYSTELARSVDLGHVAGLRVKSEDGKSESTWKGKDLHRATTDLVGCKRKSTTLDRAMVVGGLIYGLVNVRTDGTKILCATLDESSQKWRIETVKSRF
ncbi:MAG: hypothetical protein U0572_01880 [Phycisphaerales bacterium]